jgi:hypothetical protein
VDEAETEAVLNEVDEAYVQYSSALEAEVQRVLESEEYKER